MKNLLAIDPLPTIRTEQDVENFFDSSTSNSAIMWYKNLNGSYVTLTKPMLDFFTKKNLLPSVKRSESTNMIFSKKFIRLKWTFI